MRTTHWSSLPCRPALLTACTLALLAAFTAGGASAEDDQDREDFFGSYTHRTEGVTVGVGDAAASNAAAQIINPWPPYARDRRILSESRRMNGAIQRYYANSGAKPLQVQQAGPADNGAQANPASPSAITPSTEPAAPSSNGSTAE